MNDLHTWQKTRGDYVDGRLRASYKAMFGSLESFDTWKESTTFNRMYYETLNKACTEHKAAVRDALSQGVPVPVNVLSAYASPDGSGLFRWRGHVVVLDSIRGLEGERWGVDWLGEAWTQYRVDGFRLNESKKETHGDYCTYCADEMLSGWCCTGDASIVACNRCVNPVHALGPWTIIPYKEWMLRAWSPNGYTIDFGSFASREELLDILFKFEVTATKVIELQGEHA